MDSVIIASIITSGGFLISAAATIIFTRVSKKLTIAVEKNSLDLSKKFEKNSLDLSKKFDESAQITFIDGEKAAFDALTRLTLSEQDCIKVTRFNSRSIQRQDRYFSSVVSRITGGEFEGESQSKLEKYNRLTSLNSEENKQSIISQVEEFLKSHCDRLIMRITTNKNDFEVVICDGSETAVICFHDFGTQNVIHSCLITRDHQVFRKFRDLYEKLWNEDILMEIDFSLGEKHVKARLDVLKFIDPIEKKNNLSPIDNMIYETKKKLEACEALIDL